MSQMVNLRSDVGAVFLYFSIL